ncbi:hypothetical protein [Conexibacter arvalis]|uniref:Serine hydrolase n=1 Tax=Conexibacter arvalis TaxID=912552 RepID=A0A840IAK6_9ACTN|nr:hypothetical protein [Conexibacter arvalis]MBB4661283.1 hypothetical protein [Conexibacter arvalis]
MRAPLRIARPLAALLLAVASAVALAACGSSAEERARTQLEQATGRGNIQETRATELEAEAQKLREELSGLKRKRASEAAANADPGAAGGGASGSGSAGGGGAILSAQARASFDQLAGSLSGPVGVAVAGAGRGQQVEQLGALQSAVAWSTSKVPVAMAAISAGVANDGDLRQAITASDNAAATRLWDALGGGGAAAAATDAQLRAAGDEATATESRTLRSGFTPFGQTNWALADQARFTAGMACTEAGGQVLGLMGEVISAHRWGLGATGLPAQLKGGWGPGSSPGSGGGYLDRQMGIVTVDGKPLAVAIAAQPGDGSHESGTTALTTLARWVVDNADVSSLPAEPAC